MSTIPSVSFDVVQRFHGLRKRYLITWIIWELAVACIAIVGLWSVMATIDYVWELPLVVRRIGVGTAACCLLAWFFYRGSSLTSAMQGRRFAAFIEQRFSGFGQRLRTVLDIVDGRAAGPSEMLSALSHQTLGRWETLAPAQVIPRSLMWLALTSAVCALLGLSVLLNLGQWRTAMWRTVGSDQSYTTLRAIPGDSRLVEGESIRVAVELQGRTHRTVTLRYRFEEEGEGDSGLIDEGEVEDEELTTRSIEPLWEWSEIDLLAERTANKGVFSAELGKAQKSLQYQFVTSAGSTPIYRIRVEPLIEVISCVALVTSPAYTNLAPREFDSVDVSALQGSEVVVSLVTNHPVLKSKLSVGPKKSQLEPVDLIASSDPTHFSFTLSTLSSIHWRFEGEGEHAVPLAPVEGRLRVRFDQAPRINWRGPVDGIEVHTLTELPLEVSVSDDYGLVEAGIVFQLGDEDEFILTQWNAANAEIADSTSQPEGSSGTADLESALPSELMKKLVETLPLESFGLTEQDYVAYYAFAIDNREGNSNRSESDVRYIDIRPLRQFFRDRTGMPGSSLGNGFSTSVGEIIARQRFLINKTRRFVRSGSNLEQQLGTIDNLVREQSDLAGLARFLIDRLAELGRDENEALAVAETAMLQAADSLAVGNFDLTLTQQEEAMRALVEAKDKLRELITSNLTSQQRSGLSNLLRQLNQKLRRRPVETDRELADSLHKLAEDQLKLGDAVENISRDPTTTDTPQSEPEEQLSARFDEQLAHLQRLQEIGDKLSERILESELVKSRLTISLEGMGKLADQLKEDALTGFQANSSRIAEDLIELSLLIDAVSEREAVDRLPAIGELIATLAALEQRLAGTQPPATDAISETANSRNAARRILARNQTLSEALRIPLTDNGQAGSAVSESLATFLEETDLASELSESEQAALAIAEQTADEKDPVMLNPQLVEAASRRAGDLNDAAMQLEAIYRQLVTPRLERLREIEKQASQLERDLVETGDQENSEFSAELRELELTLRAAGLNDVAAVLSESSPPVEGLEGESMSGVAGEGRGGATARLHTVVKQLRDRIQNLILLDIAVDRDMIVPVQYRELVDRYFQAISGAASDPTDESQSSTSPSTTSRMMEEVR